MNRLIKGIKNPFKAIHYLKILFDSFYRSKKGCLVMVGLDPNGELELLRRGYKICIGIEANPDRFNRLIAKFGKCKNVRLFNVAAANYNGEIDFNISSNNNGASSSIGFIKKEWQLQQTGEKIEMLKIVKVKCVILNELLERENINFVDDYISDIQGMDLEVLKSLKEWIITRKIQTIRCEVTKNIYGNVYDNLPDNSETGFSNYLSPYYNLVARGWGILKDGVIEDIPDEQWEMDCKWVLKD